MTPATKVIAIDISKFIPPNAPNPFRKSKLPANLPSAPPPIPPNAPVITPDPKFCKLLNFPIAPFTPASGPPPVCPITPSLASLKVLTISSNVSTITSAIMSSVAHAGLGL